MALGRDLPPQDSPAARIGPRSANARAANEPATPEAKPKQAGITTERFNAIIREQARLPGGATLTPGVIDAITNNANPQSEEEAKAIVAEVNAALVSMTASGRTEKAVKAVQAQIKEQESTMQLMAGVGALLMGQLKGDKAQMQQAGTLLGTYLANRPKDPEISPQMAELGGAISAIANAFHKTGTTVTDLGGTTAALANGEANKAAHTPDAALLEAQKRKAVGAMHV